MVDFLKAYHARLYAVAVAGLLVAVHYVPDLPVDLIGALVAAALGEGVQRVSAAQTEAALYTPVPVEEDGA